MVGLLKSALEQHEVQRVQARVRRHRVNAEQSPAQPLTAAGERSDHGVLAAKLGIRLSEDEPMECGSSSESLSSDDKDEGEAATTMESDSQKPGAQPMKGGVVIISQCLTYGISIARRKSDSFDSLQFAAGVAMLKASPKITGLSPVAAPVLSRPVPANRKEPAPKAVAVVKRSPDVRYDELEQIAAIIAGAGIKEDEEVKDLADAVKGDGSKKKKGKK